MKKIVLATLLASAFVSTSAFAFFQTDGGTVNFTGKINGGSCSISAGDVNKAVQLPNIRSSKFSNIGDVSGAPVSFDITLEDCVVVTGGNTLVSISFTGDTASVAASGGAFNALRNTAGLGGAENIAIQLYEEGGSRITLGKTEQTTPFRFNDGENKIHLSADYVATATTVKPGKVLGVADFFINYE